jgi:hypothetical protein
MGVNNATIWMQDMSKQQIKQAWAILNNRTLFW